VATLDAAEQTVRALFAAFAERDVDGVLAHVHPDVLLLGAADGRGRSTARSPTAATTACGPTWPTSSARGRRSPSSPQDFRVAGGGVICFGVAEGRARGAETAQRLPVIWVFRLRDGLVVFCRVARTAAEATELVGAPAARGDADDRG
jgi:ketosteroid isomerase-like protein